MTTYLKNLSPSGNAKDAQGRMWLVQEQPRTFRFPYTGWNRDGKDTTKAETLEAALAAFGLTAYAKPIVPRPAYYRLDQDTIITRLVSLGKYTEFKAALQGLSEVAWDRFMAAPYIASTDAMFVQYAPQMKAALDLTDEQFDALIAPE
jgi:hypothetical protein